MENNPELPREIQGAQTPQALAKVMAKNDLTPGMKLEALMSKLSSRSAIRTGITVIAFILICVATYLSYVGAGFIFSYGGLFSGFFFFLDVVLLILMWRDAVSGTKVIGILLMELLTFIYFGYTINGYFGGGSAQGVADKKVTEMYGAAGKTYGGDAASLINMVQAVKSDAVKIQAIELEHDGIKGVVYQKAQLVADMKVEVLPPFPTPATAPAFKNLPEANQWLQAQADELNKQVQKYQSISTALTQRAKGAAEGVKEAITSDLSLNQTSNMKSLEKTLTQIGNYAVTKPDIKATAITAADFQVDNFQKIMGYAIEGVIAVFLILLAFAFPAPKSDMAELRQEALKGITLKGLHDNGVPYHEVFETASPTVLSTINVLMNNPDKVFKNYVNQPTTDFGGVVEFITKHPELAAMLPTANDNKWKLGDIKKLMEENDETENYLEEIIATPRLTWKEVSAIVKPVSKAVRIVKDPEALRAFNGLVDSLKRKLNVSKHEDLERALNQLLVEQPSVEYLQKTQALCEKLHKSVILKLDRSFIQAVSTSTVRTFITQAEEAEFENIMRDWTSDDNDKFDMILSNGIAKETGFELLMDVVFINGVTGFRKMAASYEEQTKAARSKGMGATIGISEEGMRKVDAAIKKQEKGEFYSALSEIFEVKGARA